MRLNCKSTSLINKSKHSDLDSVQQECRRVKFDEKCVKKKLYYIALQ